MDYTELAKELLGALIRKDNYKNIIEATNRLSDSALLCRYLQDNGSSELKEICENTNIPYEKLFDTVRVLIEREIVSCSGFLALNENSVIAITSKGAQELERISNEAVLFVSKQLNKLSPEEAEQFVTYSLKVINTDSEK